VCRAHHERGDPWWHNTAHGGSGGWPAEPTAPTAFLIFASIIGSTSTAIAVSFVIVRLRYLIYWPNPGLILLAIVTLQCFL
jgi:hypothetical protein